jgi:hypothetical protein
MFRATHITSACAGAAVGAVASIGERVSPGAKGLIEVLLCLLFFAVNIFCVMGLPQWRESRERNEARSFLFCFRIRNLRQEMELFFIPVWVRCFTFIACAACIGIASRLI